MAVAGIRLSDEAVLAIWGVVPGKFKLPTGDWIHGAQVGWTDGVYLLADYVIVDNPPSVLHENTGETTDLTGSTYTLTYQYSVPTDNAENREKYEQLIDAEKRRRLALGGVVEVSAGKNVNVKLRTEFDLTMIALMAQDTATTVLYADAVTSLTILERQTLLEAAVTRERYLETKAYQLRQLSTMATDYTDDSYWTNGS